MNAVAQEEITRYVAAVRAALADLPPHERDELLEDLPEHLAEVVAEDDGSLRDRLGPPESYAAELRASAGLNPGPAGAGGGARLTARAGVVLAAAAGHARRWDAKLGPLLGYSRASEF